jgi:hypothetical protein
MQATKKMKFFESGLSRRPPFPTKVFPFVVGGNEQLFFSAKKRHLWHF